MKILNLPHRTADYLCPINGFCDTYEWKSGKRPPDDLTFYLQTGFTYIQNKSLQPQKLVFFGNGIGKRQFTFLQDLIGFDLNCSENKEFQITLNKVKNCIDGGIPVVLFGLNMYHLSYLTKFYHRFPVPGHIILMVGYDEQKQIVYIHDNSQVNICELTYSDLEMAWKDGFPGQSGKNAFFGLDFNCDMIDIEEFIKKGLKKRAQMNLNPPIKNFGMSGMRKLSKDIVKWEAEMDEDNYTNALKNLVTFTSSTVPELPRELRNYDTGIDNPHKGARDKFAKALMREKDKLGTPVWEVAAELFFESGEMIGKITEILTDKLLKNITDIGEVSKLLNKIADTEEKAFNMFL